MGIQVLRGKMLKIKIIALLVNTFVEKSYQQIYAWQHHLRGAEDVYLKNV